MTTKRIVRLLNHFQSLCRMRTTVLSTLLSIACFARLLSAGLFDFLEGDRSEFPSDYGVDVSFPIHHNINRHRYAHQHRRYLEIMKGCYEQYGSVACENSEQTRMQMNLQQPATQHNYTAVGFKKMRLPQNVWAPLLAFYMQNKENEKRENWPPGNTYVNHWTSPSYMVSFEDTRLRGGLQLKQLIWQSLRPIIEEWVGYPVEPTSLYGIRVYKRGAILATHVDRLPLVSSAIIQVAQRLDPVRLARNATNGSQQHQLFQEQQQELRESQQCGPPSTLSPPAAVEERTKAWFLEVYDHAGRAHNISMCPGDLVLYESHSVLHGRPFPLQGDHYANVFVHFKPRDHDALNLQDRQPSSETDTVRDRDRDGGGIVGGHEQSNHINNNINNNIDNNNNLDPFRRRFTHGGLLSAGSPVSDNNAAAETTPQQQQQQQQKQSKEQSQEREQTDDELVDNAQWRSWLGSVARCDEDALQTQLREARTSLGDAFVRRLVREGRDRRHWSLLHEAVRAQCVSVARLLLGDDFRADPAASYGPGKDARWLAHMLFPDPLHPLRQLLDRHTSPAAAAASDSTKVAEAATAPAVASIASGASAEADTAPGASSASSADTVPAGST